MNCFRMRLAKLIRPGPSLEPESGRNVEPSVRLRHRRPRCIPAPDRLTRLFQPTAMLGDPIRAPGFASVGNRTRMTVANVVDPSVWHVATNDVLGLFR